MMTFPPGWATTITIDTEDLTVVGNVVGLSRARGALAKSVFGADGRREIPGQGSGTLQCSGHVSVEKLPALEAMYASQVALAYTVQVGTAGGDDDAGSYAGSLVITALDLTAESETEWDWSISANLDGLPEYTAPTP